MIRNEKVFRLRAFDLFKGLGEEDSDAPSPQINVVLNWFEELKQRVPVQ